MHRIPLFVVAVTGAVLLVSCGGDNSASVTATTASTVAATTTTSQAATTTTIARTTTTEAAATTTTEAAAPSTTNPNSVESVTEKATGALLAPSDVGPGFAASAWEATDPARPGPCGQPSIDSTIVAPVHVGTVISNETTQQALQQEIRVYTDAAEGASAYNVGVSVLACTEGTLPASDGTQEPLTIGAPQDVVADVGGDEATAWSYTSADTQGVAVIVRLGAAVITYQFVVPAGSTATEPAPLDLANAGLVKIRNA